MSTSLYIFTIQNLTIINVKNLTMKIANVYQQIESIGSIMVNLLNFLLLGWWDGSSCSSVMVRMVVDGVEGNDGVRDLFGRFPFGRFKLLFWSWLFDGSADADLSLDVSREADDGIWWILNAGLIWSNFFYGPIVLRKNPIATAESKWSFFLCSA